MEKGPHSTAVERQIETARDLAHRHNLTVAWEHVFTDIEVGGTVWPECWAQEGQPSRPALSALIGAIERGEISHVIVHRVEKLGTAFDVLNALATLFRERGVRVVCRPELLTEQEDASGHFAISILRPCLQVDTDADRERRAKLKTRKIEEIQRLQAKIHRLEAELAELND
jgi:DNA invertase Pin-like site-specific DNA recombinase